MNSKETLIVAIDTGDLEEAKNIVLSLKGQVYAVKLGLEFYTSQGAQGVKEIKDLGVEIFLDLKFHDIPNTVAGAIREATKLGVRMITIHTLGGGQMMERANQEAVKIAQELNIEKPLILGVTILTSMSDKAINDIGIENSMETQVLKLARLANISGLDGVVCSAHEISSIKEKYPKLKLIVPGIRFEGDDIGDQKRVKTPKEAIKEGADYLVMGRSITKGDVVQQLKKYNS